jgi:carboxylesterase
VNAAPLQDLAADPRTQAFDLGQGRPCLLLHGFTGTPFEMRPLGEALARRGYRAVGPRLAGHASTVEALAQSSAQAWYAGVARELERLALGGPRVHLIGLSMGAMLALRLAAEHVDQVGSLTLLAPAAQFRWPLRATFALFGVDRIARRWPSIEKRSVGLADREMADVAPRMTQVPTATATHVVATQRAGWAAAKSVGVASLVVYGALDRTVTEAGVQELARRLRPPPVEVLRLTRSAHVLPLDVEREDLAAAVGRFIAGRDALRG